jgi:hypothetical protein
MRIVMTRTAVNGWCYTGGCLQTAVSALAKLPFANRTQVNRKKPGYEF